MIYDNKPESKEGLPLLIEAMAFDYLVEQGGEGDESKPLVLKGVLQKYDTLNQNKRSYPEHILKREVNNYQKFIRERRSFGELDHPAESIIELKNTSHFIIETWWEGRDLWGRVQILGTPSGNIIKEIIKAGCTVGISSRGVGSTQHENGVDVVQDDFMLICWDFVSEPSTPGAFMFKEGKRIDTRTGQPLREVLVPLTEINKVFSKTDLLFREANRLKEIFNQRTIKQHKHRENK